MSLHGCPLFVKQVIPALPIFHQAVPSSQKDFIQTGTGKWVAYAFPGSLLHHRGPQAPTLVGCLFQNKMKQNKITLSGCKQTNKHKHTEFWLHSRPVSGVLRGHSPCCHLLCPKRKHGLVCKGLGRDQKLRNLVPAVSHP